MSGSHRAVPTKITRPLCRDLFPRTRLYTLLDQLRDTPALWISGPPGSGKTALVSSYIDRTGLTCIWYQVDAEDSDPFTFFYYLAKGAEQADGHKLHVPPFTVEYYANPLSFTRWYLEQLCARLSPPVVFVFDNYQELPEDSLIHNIVDTIIGDLPPGMQLVIISRNTLPAAFIRLKLNGKIATVSWPNLQLTLDESEGILTMRGSVSKEKISLLHEKAAGWVAGLLLLEAGMHTEQPPDINITDESREEVFQYFAAEIFDRLDKTIRNFLLRTSLLPHMTISMARKLSSEKKSTKILLTLNRHNYIVSRRPGFKSTYQYHPLFREFLLAMTENEFTKTSLRDLQEKGALLLQNSGETAEAASLFVQAESWQNLKTLILANAAALHAEGRIRPLMEWIEAMPTQIRDDSPWLLYWLGVCRIFLDPVHSMPLLEKAYHLFKHRQDIPGLLLCWAAIINSILLKSGSFSPFQQWIDEFTHLEQFLDHMPLQIQAPVIVSMLYALGLASTDPEKFDKWVERGENLIQQNIDVVNKAHTFNLLIVKSLFRGDLAGAKYYLTLFRSFDQSRQLPPFSRIQLKNCAASFSWMNGNFDDCEQEAHAGLNIAEMSGVHLYNHYFYGQLAAGALSENHRNQAEQYLQKMAGCMDRMRPWEQSFFHVLSTWAALLENNASRALLHAETGVRLILSMGTSVNNDLIYLGMALALDINNRPEKALEYLSKSLDVAKQAEDLQSEFSSLLAGAWMSFQKNSVKRAETYLSKALAIGRENRYSNGYFWHQEQVIRLFYLALERGIEEEYVRDVVRRREMIPSSPPVALENWPWKIKIYTLGRFSLLVNDKSARFSRKAKGKPLELLHALIALGGRNISQEKLAEYLWPDALGDAGISALSTTMQRLRKILSTHDAVIVQNGLVTINPKFCWVDTWAFERLVSQVSSTENGTGEGKRQLLQKAIALYNGPFLLEIGSVYWALAMRERLQKDFSWLIIRMAEKYIQRQDYQNGCRYLEKAIGFDPANEEICRLLLQCYAEAGMADKVRQAYESFRSACSDKADIEPLGQIKDLYEGLYQKN